MDTPPDKLSDLIELAIKDLKAAMNDPYYIIDMCEWHSSLEGICSVCFAGSVMAKTLKKSRFHDLFPHHFPREWQAAFDALDEVRDYDLKHSCEHIGLKISDDQIIKIKDAVTSEVKEWGIPFKEESNLFIKSMHIIAAELRKIGL